MFLPLQGCDGDELLRVRGERGEERVPSRRIELAKNVVQQKQRRRAFFCEDPGLRDFQSEGEGALLAFRRVILRGHAIDKKIYIVAMWPNDCLAQANFLSLRCREMHREILLVTRRVMQIDLFACGANRGVCLRNKG